MANQNQSTNPSPAVREVPKSRKAGSSPADSAKLHPTRPSSSKPVEHPDPPANSKEIWSRGLDWPIVIWICVIHVGALAACLPFFFSWQGVVCAGLLCWLTGSLGVCMGYHRLLTHGSFQTYRPIRWTLALLGGLSGEGSALTWVANHRKHHVFSDKEGDPHSPRDGKWWSHMFWFMPNMGQRWNRELCEKYAPDILKDPMLRLLHKLFLPSHFALGAILLATGWLVWGWQVGVSMLIWGLGVRMVYVLHVTWCVNSASHIWGYRNYETTDDSRNNWWVGLLAFGEGWHNNHHAYQHMARQGHKWWEIDTTYWVILLMEKTGLAWKVIKEIPPNTKPA